DGQHAERLFRSDYVATSETVREEMYPCRVGVKAAKQLGVQPRDVLNLRAGAFQETCFVSTIESFGASEDSQVLTRWIVAAQLAGHKDLSVLQLNVPGTTQQIEGFVSFLQRTLPGVEVH